MSYDLKLTGGDLAIEASGTPSVVFDDTKLRQDLLKIILTPIGSNNLYPWYGSPINAQTIGKVLDPKIINLEATNAIIYSVNNLIRLQKNQERSGQFLSPGEALSQILNISVERSDFDSRQININVDVSTRRASVVSEAFSLAT